MNFKSLHSLILDSRLLKMSQCTDSFSVQTDFFGFTALTWCVGWFNALFDSSGVTALIHFDLMIWFLLIQERDSFSLWLVWTESSDSFSRSHVTGFDNVLISCVRIKSSDVAVRLRDTAPGPRHVVLGRCRCEHNAGLLTLRSFITSSLFTLKSRYKHSAV